ncbi:TRAP transporter substrate-binding protein (plasmid) [Caballeronia sp. NK8]|uniref:TRAP transporter substrate-binding protein n=1 Tax=Caballeronia sp. NK8 TaxID=140098 RepID=UPI001BB57590|nr:TRAP transporter substrate-binding protein [Caballeronia sp. NK8]BCQ28139.1 TRAP transporter substrate-binding protein [Caballeronia sp. NK8]
MNPGHNPMRRDVLKALAFASVAAARPAYCAIGPDFTYRLGMNQPVGSPAHVRIAQMAEAINQESDGRLRIDVYPNSTLGSDNEMLTAVRAGSLDLYLAGNNLGPVAEVSELPSLPYVFEDNAHVFEALDGELGDYIRQQLDRNGLHAFRYYMQNGFHQLTNIVRPVKTAEDLRGMIIRTPVEQMPADFFRLFGAVPKGITFNKMYASLRDGVAQGQTDPMGIVVSLRLYEVQKYLSLTNHWWSGFLLVANPDSWKQLPREMQDIVTRNQKHYAILQRDDVYEIERTAADFLAAKGMLVNDADQHSFRRALGGFYEKWRGVYGAEVWSILRRYSATLN